jgi:hypothetical protein
MQEIWAASAHLAGAGGEGIKVRKISLISWFEQFKKKAKYMWILGWRRWKTSSMVRFFAGAMLRAKPLWARWRVLMHESR